MELLYGLALSTHLGTTNSYNGYHPYVTLKSDNMVMGLFYNSVDNISPYIGLQYTNNNVLLEGGIAGGYNDIGSVVPYMRFGYKLGDNTLLFVAPSAEKNNGDLKPIAVLGLELNLN